MATGHYQFPPRLTSDPDTHTVIAAAFYIKLFFVQHFFLSFFLFFLHFYESFTESRLDLKSALI